MRENNLIQNNKKYFSEEKKEIYKKTQLKSLENRRQRKTFKEQLDLLLSDENIQETICLSIVGKAINGNVKAFEVIRDTVGERPKNIESTNIFNLNRTLIVNDLPDEECISDYLEHPDNYLTIKVAEKD